MEQVLKQFLQRGEFRKALNLLKNLESSKPDNLLILFYLGKVYFELNDHKNSIFYFRKCNQIQPGNSKILYNIAQVLQGLGKVSEAKKIYERLIKKNPNDIKSYYGLFNLDLKNINNGYLEKLQILSKEKQINLFDKCLINFILSKFKKKTK